MGTANCFYAVRKGVRPGIYESWDECKPNVHKFSFVHQPLPQYALAAHAHVLHHPARGGILREIISPEHRESFLFKAVPDNQPKSLGAYSSPPIWASDPIAHFTLVFRYFQIGKRRRKITCTTYRLTGVLQDDRPHAFPAEDRTDDFPALIQTPVRRPARTGPDFRVGRIFEERRCVFLQPGTQYYPIRLHLLSIGKNPSIICLYCSLVKGCGMFLFTSSTNWEQCSAISSIVKS